MNFAYFIDRKVKFFLDFVKLPNNFVRISKNLKKCENLEKTRIFENFLDFRWFRWIANFSH